MIVYVDGKAYDSQQYDVGVLLTEKDKENIAKMLEECDCYIVGTQLNKDIVNNIADLLKKTLEDRSN